MPWLFELIDFRNCSCEGRKVFLSHLKHSVKHRSGRNLKDESTLRDFPVKLASKLYEEQAIQEDATNEKIASHFGDRSFAELEITLSPENEEDVTAFLENLETYGYRENRDWTWRYSAEW